MIGMKVLAPILLIIGTLYSFHQFTFCWWVAGCSSETGAEKSFHVFWAGAFGIALLVSLLSWVAYAVFLWRRKSAGGLVAVYLGLWALLMGGGLLWIKYLLPDKM